MTSSGFAAFATYLASVDGYVTQVPCVQFAYSNGFVQVQKNNCQSTAAAAVYGSCMCQKNSNDITSSITSLCYTQQHCTNGESSSALGLYSEFCSSATALVEQISGGGGGGGSSGSGGSTGGGSGNSQGGSSGSSVSPGAIAGIVIGVIIGIILVACAIYFGLKHYRDQQRRRAQEDERRRAQNALDDLNAPDRQSYHNAFIGSPQSVRMEDSQNGSVYRPSSSLGYPMS